MGEMFRYVTLDKKEKHKNKTKKKKDQLYRRNGGERGWKGAGLNMGACFVFSLKTLPEDLARFPKPKPGKVFTCS